MIHNIFLLKKIITIRDLTIMSFFKKKKKTVMLVGKKSIFIGDKLDPFQLERDINRASLFIKEKKKTGLLQEHRLTKGYQMESKA